MEYYFRVVYSSFTFFVIFAVRGFSFVDGE